MKRLLSALFFVALAVQAFGGPPPIPPGPPFQPSLTRSQFYQLVYTNANAARISNPRIAGLVASPPTITPNGTSKPAGQTKKYAVYDSTKGAFNCWGGTISTSASTLGRTQSSTIWTTGGNFGTNDGKEATYSRCEMIVDANAVTFAVCQSAVAYRFIINGQYISTTGTTTTNAGPSCSTADYITLDFTAVGGRAVRDIIIESQQNGGFQEAWVGATETIRAPETANQIKVCFLLDSYAFGTAATNVGDGMGAVLGDWNGWHVMNSAGPGTGWATTNSAYRFDQRIVNGDCGLGGTPDIVVTGGSYNDRNNTPATITANALAGLQSARSQYPNAKILVFGAFPGSTGPSAGILAAENAVSAAVTSFNDSYTVFIPVSTATTGPFIFGTGTTAAPNGTGNSDVYTSSDGVHPPTLGHAVIGEWLANALLNAIRSLPQQ